MTQDPDAKERKGVAKLYKKETRSETGLFLLEGSQGFKEALQRPKLIQVAYATQDFANRNQDILQRAMAARVSVKIVSDNFLVEISDTVTPQGIVAVVSQFPVSVDAIVADSPKLVAMLINVRDPGNAGTIIRAADAAGCDALILSQDSVDLYNPKVVRSTTGSLFHLPVATDAAIAETIEKFRAASVQVLAADIKGEPLPALGAQQLNRPTLWLFGNEAWGLESDVLERADRVVSLPIYGAAESLNLATAASVCLYASAFAQRG